MLATFLPGRISSPFGEISLYREIRAKGGVFLYALTNFDSRVTVDVDFLLRKEPNTSERVKSILEEIIKVPTGNDFITFEIKTVRTISTTRKYAGINASIVTHIKSTRTPFSIDIGIGDVVIPNTEKRKIPTQLPSFESPTVCTYSLETTVSEKIDAILSLMEFSSRMKDYYDLFYVASKFDFAGEILTEALRTTFSTREHVFTTKQFKEAMNFADDIAMQKKWKVFVIRTNIKTDDYSIIMKTIRIFLEKPFHAVAENEIFRKHWSAAEGKWI